MNITYKQFTTEYLGDVKALQNEWTHENITFGIVSETEEEILEYKNNYSYIALDNDNVIGYTTAEVITDNEYNVFPKGASYLRVNDLYVHKDYRSKK